jgi:hypothetical protein
MRSAPRGRAGWASCRGCGAGVESLLAAAEGIGPPDYLDDGMIQYLRAERIVAPYQTRGVKVVEMVRLYPAGTMPRA